MMVLLLYGQLDIVVLSHTGLRDVGLCFAVPPQAFIEIGKDPFNFRFPVAYYEALGALQSPLCPACLMRYMAASLRQQKRKVVGISPEMLD